VVHFESIGATSKLSVYRLETQMTAGNGKHSTSGFGSDTSAKEQVRVGFEYFKGNLNRIAATSRFSDHEFHLHFVDLQRSGNSHSASLSSLVACCSILLGKSVQEKMVVLGSMTLGGVVSPVQDLASSMQVALEAGATKVLIPMASATVIRLFRLRPSRNSKNYNTKPLIGDVQQSFSHQSRVTFGSISKPSPLGMAGQTVGVE
jgi:ATP-dependent Lon protease